MASTTKIQKKPSAPAAISTKGIKPSPTTKVKSKPAPASSIPAKKEDFQEVRSLIELMKKNGLAVFKFEQGDFKITLKTPEGASGGATVIHGAAAPAAPAHGQGATPAAAAPTEPAKTNYKEIKSPMVGTFYASSAPEADAFVSVGTTINPESVVCIIEAMKVMNEIKAEIAGKVVEIVAENGKPVQFGEVLFRVS